MRFKRSLMKFMATTLVVVMFVTSFGTAAHAGLFTKLKDAVSNNPVKSALAGIAAVGGSILAAPYVARAVGFASGSIGAVAAGASTTVAAAGSGLAGIGATIWGGVSAAGGFVTGVLGSIGGAIGSVFSGIAGFVGGIVGSPLFVPALCIVGAATAGYFLYKHYKRQKKSVTNNNDIPSISVSDNNSVVVADESSPVIPSASNSLSPVEAPVNGSEIASVDASSSSSDELTRAHSDYIEAYNKYINLVTNIGGSENLDEEVRSNMLRSDTQAALTAYREAYNRYVTLLRQSNSN